jgi:hypothetical protein
VAVQWPEDLAEPECPFQVPPPFPGDSRPDPDANLSCTVTEARTAPFGATLPRNLTRFGWVIAPSEIFASKLYVGSQEPTRVVKARCHGPSYIRALAGYTVIAQMAATMAIFVFVMT